MKNKWDISKITLFSVELTCAGKGVCITPAGIIAILLLIAAIKYLVH
jgi:hypothetical protein